MAVPKRKKSKSRVRMHRQTHRTTVPAAKPCPNCGAVQRTHRVCTACGYYRERQVLTITAE
ncbi:MAG: 50S ribosomal protein L32 [Kiritimatiellia bacterium]|nr:50S ribosomal protein L32 [Lentisphaerota bacterium]